MEPAHRQDADRAPDEPSRPTLYDWIRAWVRVMLDPHKTIPSQTMPKEGEPIPASLELQCPVCGYCLTGLCQWQCPECGERFRPQHAYLLKMLRRPEYFLRYRYDPPRILAILCGSVLFGAGLILAYCSGLLNSCLGGLVMTGFATGGVVLLLLQHLGEFSWEKAFAWVAAAWCAAWLALLVVASLL